MHKKQSEPRSVVRKRAVTELKRSLILEAARVVFEREGLARANIRQIAAQAGYTPGAIYFHYASKEEIYAELLAQSLDRLHQHTRQSRDLHRAPGERLRAAALAFFDYYATHPRELEMGFYLFGGRGREQDEEPLVADELFSQLGRSGEGCFYPRLVLV